MAPSVRWLYLSVCVASAGVGSFFGSRSAVVAIRSREARPPELAQELGLSPEQTAMLQRMQSEMLTRCQEADAEVACSCGELCRIVREPAPDRREIESYLARAGAAQTEIQREAVGQLIGIRAILDEDQRARFDQMLCGALHPGSPGPSCPPCSEPGMPGAARGAAEGAVSKGMCGGMVAPKR